MSNSNFSIVKQNERFALYQDGILVNTYSRKDSAVRRMKKMQLAEVTEFTKEISEDVNLVVKSSQNLTDEESKFNFALRAASECLYFVDKASQILDKLHNAVGGEAQSHALTQRFIAGAAHGVARSPPLG